MKVVDHSGHTLPLTIVVIDKSCRTTLDVFNSSYLLPGVWVPYTVQQYSKCGRTSEMCRLAVVASGRFL